MVVCWLTTQGTPVQVQSQVCGFFYEPTLHFVPPDHCMTIHQEIQSRGVATELAFMAKWWCWLTNPGDPKFDSSLRYVDFFYGSVVHLAPDMGGREIGMLTPPDCFMFIDQEVNLQRMYVKQVLVKAIPHLLYLATELAFMATW